MNVQNETNVAYASPFKQRYDNYIGGKFTPPVNGRYFDNTTPITGAKVCEVARSDAADVELALDAAHAAKAGWGATSAAERSNILLKIADRIEENLETIAIAETWDNGKPIRETTAADIRCRLTISGISPGCCAVRKAPCPKSTRTLWPITIMNRWAWSVRSSRGTFRC